MVHPLPAIPGRILCGGESEDRSLLRLPCGAGDETDDLDTFFAVHIVAQFLGWSLGGTKSAGDNQDSYEATIRDIHYDHTLLAKKTY